MVAAGRWPWLTGQGAFGEVWLVRSGVWLRSSREEAVERLLPDDQVADAVLALSGSAISWWSSLQSRMHAGILNSG